MCNSCGDNDAVDDMTLSRHFILRWLLVKSVWAAVRIDPAITMAYMVYRKCMNPQKAIVKIARW